MKRVIAMLLIAVLVPASAAVQQQAQDTSLKSGFGAQWESMFEDYHKKYEKEPTVAILILSSGDEVATYALPLEAIPRVPAILTTVLKASKEGQWTPSKK